HGQLGVQGERYSVLVALDHEAGEPHSVTIGSSAPRLERLLGRTTHLSAGHVRLYLGTFYQGPRHAHPRWPSTRVESESAACSPCHRLSCSGAVVAMMPSRFRSLRRAPGHASLAQSAERFHG